MFVNQQAISDAQSLQTYEQHEVNQKEWRALLEETVYRALRHSAAAFEDTPAITFVDALDESPRTWSHRELFEGVTRAANLFGSLAGAGCGVAYILPSLVQTHFVLWGAEACGFVVPINPFLQPEEIAELVATSGARVLVFPKAVNADIEARIDAVSRRVPGIALVAVGNGTTRDGWVDFDLLSATQDAEQATNFDVARTSEDIVAYFHTGGTTGTPKLVSHTSRNQLAAAYGAAVLLSLQRTDCMTNGMPLFHVGGTISSSLSFFLSGARIVMMSPLGFRNPQMIQSIWRQIERHRVTILAAVPTAMGALLNVPVDANISTLRWGLTGASPCPGSVSHAFSRITGVALHEMLGMTESGGVTAVDPVGGTTTSGSVGFGLPFTQLEVRRQEEDGLGSECAPNEIGVLFVKGPHVSSGYLDTAQNAGVFTEGGLNTGDLAYRDESGKLFMAGRSKDLIIRSGHNIDPGMIEEAFAQHPAVALAAAVAQPDRYAGELPAVFVSLKPGATANADEIEAFARDRISERPAWPKAVHLIDAMPVTAVGKIFKPALRAQAAQHLLLPMLHAAAPGCIDRIEVTSGGKKGLHVDVYLSQPESEVIAAVKAALDGYILTWTLRD